MAKSNGFLGKSCAGFAGCESAHGAWETPIARQSVGNGAAMWALANGAANPWKWNGVFLGLAARLKDTCSVRFVLHKSLKNQRIENHVQVSC